MSGALLAASLLIQIVKADYVGAANSVVTAATDLSGKLSSWNSAAGLEGALAVQSVFPSLSAALSDYSNAVLSAKVSDIDVPSTSNVDSSVAALLAALTAKAADFNAVGAGTIATNDLKQVSGPSADIINGLVKVLPQDPAKWSPLSAGLIELESSLNDANRAYNVPEVSFVAAPPSVSGSASSSASSKSNSNAASSSAASSKGSSLSSTTSPATSAARANTTAIGGVRNGTTSLATHSQTPNVHNVAAIAGLGFGAGAAGVAALFL